MTEDRSLGDKSVLEVLDFVLNPSRIGNDNDETSSKLCELEQFVYEVTQNNQNLNEGTVIHLHEAAVFAAYYGVPRDSEIRAEWQTQTFSAKIARIKTRFCELKHTSFKRFL
jgi:hypothetical protein